ncbi:tRNA-guanine transglycosylase [Lactobacillus sp. 0.1XD8-4]|uniref:tRNA-ribosyltransferase family protein n=1 Tax=uncultured Limosilactobacillus sp. TaxID=2837629 RepID=UPI00129DDF14|nr:tRNA guanosine(34) transglycosylase Tgt [uncultured Limosilactobacillus sp.]MRN06361.1 tRNA-guanine transglycosylase [Lactobacillus sp. 0.1XD8-4]
MNNLRFIINNADETARTGILQVNDQRVRTPILVQTGDELARLAPLKLEQIGVKITKVNGLKWWLKYGEELSKVGDLHQLYHWNGLMLVDLQTDYAYQLAKPRGKKNNGVRFHDPETGQLKFWQPETALKVQKILGADVFQSFDRAGDYYDPVDDLAAGVAQTQAWLEINKKVAGMTFANVVGGGLKKLRQESVKAVMADAFAGYEISGIPSTLSNQEFNRIINEMVSMLPNEQLRYLPTATTLTQMLFAVLAGVDLIDSDLATKKAAKGVALVGKGLESLHLDRQHFRFDKRPLEQGCGCPVCQTGYSRALIHNLIIDGRFYGEQLLLQHNLFTLNRLINNLQQAIAAQQIKSFVQELLYNH